MVGTVQSDRFGVFMRKIGYSVGLESTLGKLDDLTETYIDRRNVDYDAWSSLVAEKWGRGKRDQDFGNLFGVLGYLKVYGHTVNVLPRLDAAALSRTQLARSGIDWASATRFIFLVSLIEADGEIFLNCLANEFDPGAFEKALVRVLAYKRERLHEVFRQPGLRERIDRAVAIERQGTNVGSAGKDRRAQLLERAKALRRRTTLRGRPEDVRGLSEDYKRKVPAVRQAWAKSVALCDAAGRLTEEGRKVIDNFRSAGCHNGSGDIVIWPCKEDLVRLRLNLQQFGRMNVKWWSVVRETFVALGGRVRGETGTDYDVEGLSAEWGEMFGMYRRMGGAKTILRRELPLTVAYLATAATRLARSEPLENLPVAVEEQRKLGGRSGVMVRTSRESMGTLSFVRERSVAGGGG